MYGRESCSEPSPVKVGMMAAAISAAITYLIFGTEKGDQVRSEISEGVSKMKKKAMMTGSDISSSVKEIFNETFSYLKEKRDQLKNLDKEDVEGLMERLLERWDETKEDIEDTLKQAEEESK